MKPEYRQIGKIHDFRQQGDEGFVDAYLTTWGSIDWYNSTFAKGAFAESFRTVKMRNLFNHETLIGKVLEAREDDIGPFVRTKINLKTTAGKDTWEHIVAEDIDCFSFGFNVIKDSRNKAGVRVLEQVEVLECGPVVFEANGTAKIVDVRTGTPLRGDQIEWNKMTLEERSKMEKETDAQPDGIKQDEKCGEDKRNIDYDVTKRRNELVRRGSILLNSLFQTLEDNYYPAIWGEGLTGDDAIANMDRAIASFHGDYIGWVREIFVEFGVDSTEARTIQIVPNANSELVKAFRSVVKDLEEKAIASSFTVDELRTLSRGNLLPIEVRSKLTELGEEVEGAHRRARTALVEQLCAEIRAGGLTDADVSRIQALLPQPVKDGKDPEAVESVWESLDSKFRSILLGTEEPETK